MKQGATFNPLQTALLHDAILAGLTLDIADKAIGEAPMAWAAPSPPLAAVPPIPVPAIPLPAKEALPPAVPTENSSVAPQIWHAGETELEQGGVLVVLASEAAPEGPALVLLRHMLAAVGLGAAPLGFMGLAGAVPKAGLEITHKTDFLEQLTATQAPHILLLGQSIVLALQGKPYGVEGWHAAPHQWGLQGAVGVTYPLDFLLNKPLFKGLAWQHLQRWQQSFAG